MEIPLDKIKEVGRCRSNSVHNYIKINTVFSGLIMGINHVWIVGDATLTHRYHYLQQMKSEA